METLPNSQKNVEVVIRQSIEQLKTHPHSAEAYANLGSLYALQQQWQKALACYCKAIKLNPDLAGVYRNLARVLSQVGKPIQAAQCWYRALLLEPEGVKAENYLHLGLTLARQGKYEQAMDCYRRLLERVADPAPSGELALPNAQKILDLNPQSSAEDYFQLGKSLRKHSHFPEAIHCFQQAIVRDRHFKAAYAALQYTPIAAEQLAPLVAFYRQMLQRHGDLPRLWSNLGDGLTQQGKLNEAIPCYRLSSYQKALAAHPNLSQVYWKSTKELAPDFIIIGAAKCGTTSLYHYLGFHPQVLLPQKKELDFFNNNFALGVDWYLSHFPALADRPDFITGEASPNYFALPRAAQRLFSLFPQVKLIVLLRNPIERAVSWHYHRVNRGEEKRSLETALALEIEELKDFSQGQSSEIGRRSAKNLSVGLYLYHLQHWMSLFPRERCLILQSEDLYGQPTKVMGQVFNFLGLPNTQRARYPRFNSGSYRPLPDSWRKTLEDFFRPHNQKLEAFLGKRLNWD